MFWHQGCILTTHLAMNSLVILLKSEGKFSILLNA
jgi:hypothetical protein